jgi:long-chain acyl-CoA synthetase
MLAETKAPVLPARSERELTLNHIFRETAKLGDKPALRRKVGDTWQDISWKGYRAAAHRVANGLLKLGLEPGERVAIISQSRVEWVFTDLAVTGSAAIVVPIYQSVRDDEVGYILHDSGARYVFVEDLDQWKKVLLARRRPEFGGLPKLDKAIIFDTQDTERTRRADAPFENFVLTFDELIEKGEGTDPSLFETRCDLAKPQDVLTLVYTSGTTGQPKGVMLTHANALAEMEVVHAAFRSDHNDVCLSFLPLAHIFARAVHWYGIKVGSVVVYTTIARAADDMREVSPTVIPAVPRFFEKVHAAVHAKIEAERPLKRRYVKAALEWAREADARRRAGKPLGVGLALRTIVGRPAINALAAKLAERTGGRMRAFCSAGAPLSVAVNEFFHTLGLLIAEGYGLTETTGATHLNSVTRYRLGTVGPVAAGHVCKIASDGEILVKGPAVMQGYYNKPEATKEVFDEEGFFKTGDIGEIDSEGFLRITDRKKDLLKTAGGKYIAPQKVENMLKMVHGISQAVVIGDNRKFCTALLTLDVDPIHQVLREKGHVAPGKPEELAKDSHVLEYLGKEVAAINSELASFETIKYFRVLPREFEIGDELTPTLKVKRKRVVEKYGALVHEMYANAEKGGD